jgi:hypothetical protein
MEKFPVSDFKDLGAVWIAHLMQDHQLEVIFYDPKIDQHKTIDRALQLFTKYLGLSEYQSVIEQ